MSHQNNNSKIIPISDALKTLTTIAELPDEKQVSKSLSERITELSEDVTTEKVSALFHAVYTYLENSGEPKSRDRFKTVMEIVGEAAKTLDRYQRLFKISSKESVTQLAEYKRLQKLYSKRVERQVDPATLGQWILGLTRMGPTDQDKRKARMRKEERAKHVFVDLDLVKKDSEYELLLMRKEDGSRFYSPRLVRNIRIVSDFGVGARDMQDIFVDAARWRDRLCQRAAQNMLQSLNLSMHRFYQEIYRHKGRDFVGSLNKAFMALLLAAQADSQKKKGKGAAEYFGDFQYYLRLCLNSRYYQKLLIMPPKKNNHIARCLLSVAHNVCRVFHIHLRTISELQEIVMQLLHEAEEQFPTTAEEPERGIFAWSRLAYDYAELTKALRHHESGPLKRVLETLKAGVQTTFDPLLQLNLPTELFTVGETPCLRLACPTRQTKVNKAVVTDEFKGFLLSSGRQGNEVHHLLINMQDRTSWREFARCKTVEQLAEKKPFDQHITTVTLATDTSFYHQSGPYEADEEYEHFSEAFIEQLKDDKSGFYIPEKLHNKTFRFAKKALKMVHQLFFANERYLNRKKRQAFISIVYALLTLFLVKEVNPSSFSLSCKDGVDLGGCYGVLVYMLLGAMHSKELDEQQMSFAKTALFGSAVVTRERAPLPATVNRFFKTLQVVEGVKERMGEIAFCKEAQKELQGLFGKEFDLSGVSTPIVPLQGDGRYAA